MIPSLCRDNMDVIMMVGYETDTQFHWVVFSWRKNGTSCLLFYSAAQEFKSECVNLSTSQTYKNLLLLERARNAEDERRKQHDWLVMSDTHMGGRD